jgi:hypothetical protein
MQPLRDVAGMPNTRQRTATVRVAILSDQMQSKCRYQFCRKAVDSLKGEIQKRLNSVKVAFHVPLALRASSYVRLRNSNSLQLRIMSRASW